MKPPKEENALRRFAQSTDRGMQIDPSPAVKDSNTIRGMPPKNPYDNEQGLAKGGKVKKVTPIRKAKVGRKQ